MEETDNTSEIQTNMSAVSNNNIIQPLHQLVSVKLDESNFLIWKQQILTAIKGYGLEGFIDGTNPAPERLIEDAINLVFLAWQRQDQLLASWILSSLSDGTLILTVGLSSSKEIWDALEQNFASQTNAKIMQIKMQLTTLKKNGLTMREYLNKMKSCCDLLAIVGDNISERDQVLHIISGLGPEYNSVMVNVTSRVQPYTVSEVQALLLSFESRLETENNLHINSEGSNPSLYAITQNQLNQRRGNVQNFRGGRSSQYNFQRGGRRSGYRGRGGTTKCFHKKAIPNHVSDTRLNQHSERFSHTQKKKKPTLSNLTKNPKVRNHYLLIGKEKTGKKEEKVVGEKRKKKERGKKEEKEGKGPTIAGLVWDLAENCIPFGHLTKRKERGMIWSSLELHRLYVQKGPIANALRRKGVEVDDVCFAYAKSPNQEAQIGGNDYRLGNYYRLLRVSFSRRVGPTARGNAAKIFTPGPITSGFNICGVTVFGPLEQNAATTGDDFTFTTIPPKLNTAVGFSAVFRILQKIN
ncbi:hypothetical protein DH2020_026842 [Rehmannia glutinosa]|uniref:Uncharacterized protein n=1 Tax=Rehmannia glutinosa TaxID=99300 RepID=A0ABR0VWR9_REHGL